MSSTNEPLVEIVMLNYNGENIAEKCVQSILDKTTYKNYKIIFVDNGSFDQSLAQAEKLYSKNDKVIFVKIPCNTGYPRGMNIGMNDRLVKSDSDFFIPLNDDIIITDPDWIQKLLKPMKDPTVGVTCCSLKTPSGRIQKGGMLQFNGLTMSYIGTFPTDKDCTIDFAAMAACMIRREVFVKARGFDEKYSPFNSEETDLSLRIKYLGYSIYFIHDLVLFHDHGATLKKIESAFTYFITKRNSIRFRLLHYPWHWILGSLILEYKVLFNLFFYRDEKKIRFNPQCWQHIKAYIAAVTVNILNIGQTLDRRIQINTQKK